MQAFSARVAIKNESTTNLGDKKYWKPHICVAHFLPTPVADPDLQRRGGGRSSRPWEKGGGGLKK